MQAKKRANKIAVDKVQGKNPPTFVGCFFRGYKSGTRPGHYPSKNKGTCTVTTVEHLLAIRQPTEYARVIGELAGKSGSVTLQNGTTVSRQKGIVPADYSGRSNISRVSQATKMEYGNGALEDSHNDEDGHFGALTR